MEEVCTKYEAKTISSVTEHVSIIKFSPHVPVDARDGSNQQLQSTTQFCMLMLI